MSPHSIQMTAKSSPSKDGTPCVTPSNKAWKSTVSKSHNGATLPIPCNCVVALADLGQHHVKKVSVPSVPSCQQKGKMKHQKTVSRIFDELHTVTMKHPGHCSLFPPRLLMHGVPYQFWVICSDLITEVCQATGQEIEMLSMVMKDHPAQFRWQQNRSFSAIEFTELVWYRQLKSSCLRHADFQPQAAKQVPPHIPWPLTPSPQLRQYPQLIAVGTIL